MDMISTRIRGDFKQDFVTKEVVWELPYEQQEMVSETPQFAFENIFFKMRLATLWENRINISLFKKAHPNLNLPEVLKFKLGLRTDDEDYLWIDIGKNLVGRPAQWRQVGDWDIQETELEGVTQSPALVIALNLRAEKWQSLGLDDLLIRRVSTETEVDNGSFGAADVVSTDRGTFKQDFAAKNVIWKVPYEKRKMVSETPEFVFENTHFKMQLATRWTNWINISLYKRAHTHSNFPETFRFNLGLRKDDRDYRWIHSGEDAAQCSVLWLPVGDWDIKRAELQIVTECSALEIVLNLEAKDLPCHCHCHRPSPLSDDYSTIMEEPSTETEVDDDDLRPVMEEASTQTEVNDGFTGIATVAYIVNDPSYLSESENDDQYYSVDDTWKTINVVF